MKRVLIVTAMVLATVACLAQPTDVDVVYSGAIPQIIVWEEVATDADGNPLMEGDSITYEVFYTPSPFIEGQEVSIAPDLVLNEATVDLSALPRGYYYIGVRSIGETAGGDVEYSAIVWSNDPAIVDPTQRFAYLVAVPLYPAAPTGLRTVGP